MSAIRRVQNSECRDRGSPISMSSKRDDQRHGIQIFYIITVSCCQLSPASFFLSVQWPMMLELFFIVKISIRTGISKSYCQSLAGIFWQISLLECSLSYQGGNDKLEPTYQLVANLEPRRIFQGLSQGNWSSLIKRIHTNIKTPPHHHQVSPCK